jgi:hypothetical protein
VPRRQYHTGDKPCRRTPSTWSCISAAGPNSARLRRSCRTSFGEGYSPWGGEPDRTEPRSLTPWAASGRGLLNIILNRSRSIWRCHFYLMTARNANTIASGRCRCLPEKVTNHARPPCLMWQANWPAKDRQQQFYKLLLSVFRIAEVTSLLAEMSCVTLTYRVCPCLRRNLG